MDLSKITDRFGEASSWAGFAAALWGAVALAPEWLDGALTFDVQDWRAVFVFLAMVGTITAIAIPEPPKK